MRSMLTGAAVVLLAVVFMGQASAPKTVEAERFVVKDAAGKIRGSFGILKGIPSMIIMDEAGKPRVTATIMDDRPCLMLDGNGGKSIAGMMIEGDKGATMLLKHGDLETVAHADMLCWRADGKVRMALTIKDESAFLAFNDVRGTLRHAVGLQPSGEVIR